jgi:hypothetical protein
MMAVLIIAIFWLGFDPGPVTGTAGVALNGIPQFGAANGLNP